MDTTREHIYLAALLHDIGKFYQRADTGSVSASKYLSASIIEGQGMFLPSFNGNYTHKHCLWTAEFIAYYKSVFQSLLKSDINDLTNKDNLLSLAAGHHLPENQQSELGKIIKRADCLSSGMDRDNSDSMKDDQDENSWDSFRRKRMTSILYEINRFKEEKKEKAEKEIENFYLPLMPLCLDKKYFPDNNKDLIPDYKTLWDDFNNDFKQIQANTYHAFSETLLSLLFKYTTAIPASTINFPDVSLYDHLKTTAAIAICLYDHSMAPVKTENQFLLIGGDLSGIQSYIYQIISKYAAKNLKGRSFYLRILSDSIVRFLLKELNLFQANVIYNSGGSFYLLAPNTEDVRQKLKNAICVIEEKLFKNHGSTLYVAIDSVEISENTLMHKTKDQNLSSVWKELFEKRDLKKQAKFSSLIKQNYDSFFNPGFDERLRDAVTGEEFAKEELHKEKELVLKETTFKQIALGKALRESDVIVVSDGEVPYWKDKAFIAPADLGIYYYLLNFADVDKMKEQLRSSADKVSIVSLNGGESLDCEFMKTIDGLNNIYSLEFYGGNSYSGKTFDEMCENDSFSRLGVLRMDVDNLGSLFQSGIDPNRATLSRYAAFSRSFDYFFSGYLNKIQRDIDSDNTFIVYSGGDDVFIVGGWDKTIQIAETIQKDFKEFTCHNPAFSISGGIAILPDKFPIMKGAQESADEEGRAKGHSCGNISKDSISFMDTPLNWSTEYPAVKRLKSDLVVFVEQGFLPKSFISKLLAHAMNAKLQNHKINHLKTYWMLTYDLSRLKNTVKNQSAKELIDNCIKEVCENKSTLNGQTVVTNYHSLELWAFAARWAELEFRMNK